MTPCILWEGYKDKDGYGRRTVNRKDYRVHRLAYEEVHGPIAKGLVVRHKCDNRACYNVEHLELGKPKDNSNDMVSRGRSLVGSKHHKARLTEEDVRYIRLSKLSSKTLAETFGVTINTIQKARAGETWRHI